MKPENKNLPGWKLSRECIHDTLLAKRSGALQECNSFMRGLYNLSITRLRETQLAPFTGDAQPGRYLELYRQKRTHLSAQTEIRRWYMAAYESDELGAEIAPDLTFQALYDAMAAGEEVYAALGVGDSVIRERVFWGLAKAVGVDIDHIYDLWPET